MPVQKNAINPLNFHEPTGPHAVVGKALRKARVAKQMSAEALVEFVGGRTLTKALISSYEAGRYLPSIERLANLMGALGAEITDGIRQHYAKVLEKSAHMGQVNPGGRTRVTAAKELILAWQSSDSVQEVADKMGIDKRRLYNKVANLRKRGVPLKLMQVDPEEYEELAGYAASLMPESNQPEQS